MAFSLESDVSFSQKTAATTAKNALFYGMIILLIIFAIVGMVVLRQPMFLAYSAYSGSVLIYLMHSDGVAFQYLWPQFPLFNNNASVLIGASVCITAAICARVFVQTKRYHPMVDKILIGVIVFTFGLLAASFFVDTQVIKKLLVLTSLISIGMCLVAGLVASMKRFKQVRFFVIAWAGAVLSAGLMSLRHWLGIDISQEFQYDSMRFVMVFDASMMGMAIVDHYNQLRASRQTALSTSLSQVQQNLDLNKRLSHLEQTYSEMIERNASRKIDFTNTIHDLRQPLHALRLNVSNLSEDSAVDRPDRQMVSDTFEYLEQLISTQLSLPSAHQSEPRFVRDTPFPLQDTLERVHSMFLADAMSKGLTFRFHKNRHAIDIDPFVVLRILSNLVSNAIKYTDRGTIALGSRRVGDVLHIVVMDTGRGMSETDFENALGRSVRLEATAGTVEGNGYGLAIANQLAHQNGWTLSHRTRREGTAICLQIPMVDTLDT